MIFCSVFLFFRNIWEWMNQHTVNVYSEHARKSTHKWHQFYSNERWQNKGFIVNDELYLVEVMIFFRFEQMKRFPLFFTGSGQQVIKHVIVSARQSKIYSQQSSCYWVYTSSRRGTKWEPAVFKAKVQQSTMTTEQVLYQFNIIWSTNIKYIVWCDVPLIVLLVN